jgi:hypothetical protein
MPLDTIKRHAMRANLLATATDTSFGGLRFNKVWPVPG